MDIDIRRLLRPRSIAIVGVSDKPGTTGGNILGSLANYDYTGAIHLVSRGRTEVLGRVCYPTVDEMPENIDLAVLCLPRSGTVEALAACARRIGVCAVASPGGSRPFPVSRSRQGTVARNAIGR